MTDAPAIAGLDDRLGFSADRRLRWADTLLLIGVCAVLFGYICVSGRPMTMHEARLPQTSREMMQSHDWLVPRSGGRPWLERPPLPHWITIAIAAALRQPIDTEWIARIPPALMGMIGVLTVAWLGTRAMGRRLGVAAGLMLATTWEYYYYATLAEDDIFLAALVIGALALFAKMELLDDPLVADGWLHPLGWRRWPVVGFYLLTGLTGWVKGPGIGAIVILGPAGVFLLAQVWHDRNLRRIRRYLWIWGILAGAALAVGWQWWMTHTIPGYQALLHVDFTTDEYDEPWWFYVPTLLGVALPWSPAALLALGLTVRSAWRSENRWLRFLWCWAIVPVVLLSIPHRKHHHYLVPSLAPWAILAAIGVGPIIRHMFRDPEWRRRPSFGFYQFGQPGAVALLVLLLCGKIPGPWPIAAGLIAVWLACVWMFYRGLIRQDGRWMLASIVAGFAVAVSWGQSFWPNETVADRQLFRQAEKLVPHDELLTVDSAVGPLDFFQAQYYIRPNALLLHNLSYLRSDRITAPDAYVIARAKDMAPLQTLGDVTQVLQSAHARRETSPAERFTLFHLTFRPDLQRFPPPEVSPLEARDVRATPNCGAPIPEPP